MATPTALPTSFVAGQVLTAADQNLLRGAFRILQVVYGSTTTQTPVSSATYISTTLTASITPNYNTSKFLIIANLNLFTAASNEIIGIRTVKTVAAADTVLLTNTSATSNGGGSLRSMTTQMYLDSPATTSALTYKIEFARTTGSGTNYAQLGSEVSNIIIMEVSA